MIPGHISKKKRNKKGYCSSKRNNLFYAFNKARRELGIKSLGFGTKKTFNSPQGQLILKHMQLKKVEGKLKTMETKLEKMEKRAIYAEQRAVLAEAEIRKLKSKLEVPCYDVDNDETSKIIPSESVAKSSRKRKQTNNDKALLLVHEANKKVKIEKGVVGNLRSELEDAQETLNYVIQSENQKMTEIDQLKARITELEG
eukprot:g3952.t1